MRPNPEHQPNVDGHRMIDPMVSLAFSVYSNKGTYALLLGSGVSRASGIPTGWEVVLDLIRRVAKLEGKDCEPDPAAWFRKQHGADADYSRLLHAIARTPTERQQLLRSYFEPSTEERSEGVKNPSSAHTAIAQLVAEGFLRVIITTNFDRLMERALENVGIAPTVISTIDQIAGCLPLAHSGVTVIKLHGDYLDTRIKNTAAELGAYEPAMDKLLDRVFDEYGLIVCGWSADWDIALRAALERCPSRRFTTFWTSRFALSEQAKRLAGQRKAERIQIANANEFFQRLSEEIRALADLGAPHPLSAKMAVAMVKRYLVDSTAKIRLHDLVREETERLASEFNGKEFSAQTDLDAEVELNKRVLRYRASCEKLLSVLVAGSYWGDQDHARTWVNCLQRIANPPYGGSGYEYLTDLRKYPALILLYGAGISAVAARNYQTLGALLIQPKARDHTQRDKPLCRVVLPKQVMDDETAHLLPRQGRCPTPVSGHLFNALREALREYLPRDEDYQEAFDRFEYLLGLVNADLERREFEDCWEGPYGCFAWQGRDFPESQIMQRIGKELAAEGADWGPLKGGLFNSSLEQAKTAKAKFDAFLKRQWF
jgi:hypothetical protein